MWKEASKFLVDVEGDEVTAQPDAGINVELN
jgi:hypothetical protein